MMFLKKNRQTEDTGREKNRRAKKKTPFSHHATKHKEKLFYNKVHYLVPHALRTSIAQKKKKEKRRAGGGVLAE
jgi:hypothetical protein